MNRLVSPKSLAVAALVLGAVGAASAAHARTDVVLSIGLPVYQQPAPVYYQPAPVYYQSAPVYRSGWNNGAWGDRDHDGIPNIYDRHDNRRGHGYARGNRWGPNGDADGDGVANRFDRYPNNPYRR